VGVAMDAMAVAKF